MSVTPPEIWGGGGFEVIEVRDADARPNCHLRWHVMVNGITKWPVAWFLDEDDARLWSETMNAHFASAMSAGTAATTQIGAGRQPASATRQGDAPNGPQ